MSGAMLVPETEVRVTTDRPACHGHKELKDGVAEIASFIAVAGTITTGSPVWFVPGLVAAAFPQFKNQNYANCAIICAQVPGGTKITGNWTPYLATWTQAGDKPDHVKDFEATKEKLRPVEAGSWVASPGWVRWEEQLEIRELPDTNDKIACAGFRNWAHEAARVIQIGVEYFY